MELADIRAFARIADLGSVSAAARSLDLPKSTISRALARLELVVGAVLVDRSTRHLRLSDAGVLFRPYAIRILADVDEAGTALDNFAGAPRGTLRISAPFTFVVSILSPMLPSFLDRYPEVRVVLDVENRVIDLPLEPADLVIRAIIARHLLTTEAWTCASPGYLARCGVPASIADLSRHALIAYADLPTIWTYRMADGTTQQVQFRPANAVSDSAALLPVLVGGGGIGRLPDFAAADAVARGDLVRLFPAPEAMCSGFTLSTPAIAAYRPKSASSSMPSSTTLPLDTSMSGGDEAAVCRDIQQGRSTDDHMKRSRLFQVVYGLQLILTALDAAIALHRGEHRPWYQWAVAAAFVATGLAVVFTAYWRRRYATRQTPNASAIPAGHSLVSDLD